MDQDDTLDFKALRAKFQDEELLLKQPKIKPALPEKPKVVPPPPQSPPHHLPAGARPSLLTSISQSFEGKSYVAPRVVFKDDKKEGKKPLIQSYSKLKVGKDKTRGSKEKLEEEQSEPKKKKESGRDKRLLLLPAVQKESTAELVPATPPPKVPAQKKKGFLGFKKSSKGSSVDVPPEPILDAPSEDIPGPAPLIPVLSDLGDPPPEPEIHLPEVLPDVPPSPEPIAPTEPPPPFDIPAPPSPNRSPDFIPDPPVPTVPTLESETPPETETPTLSTTPSVTPTPVISTPSPVAPSPSPSPSPPPPPAEPEPLAEVATRAVSVAAVETPPVAKDPPSAQSSPQTERSVSALSALERAEDMGPVKRTSADQRILNALEKARKKATSPQANHSTSHPVTPPPEEPSPTFSLPELPPIDYEDKAGHALPPKPDEVNGTDHRQASPVPEVGEESDPVPDLLVAPPPPPMKVLPYPDSLGPPPEKPARPPYVNLSEFIPPPPMEEDDVHAPVEFSETDTAEVPEFDDVASAGDSPELPVSDWRNGDCAGPDAEDGQNLVDYYSNGLSAPEAKICDATALGDEYQNNAQPLAGLGAAEAANGISADNTYEDVTVSAPKKKGKSDGGKKRKGPPKNPYMEAAQELNEEKTKTSRFGKGEKKSSTEGPDEKELKKREKQQKEKEKKELKEKQEREKREQREREKKENELKKKFKISGQEDAMYQAKVTVTTKGRKNDLPVKSGDIISIIRTTNCPKGKWLARDSSNNYGYVAVDHVELDIKEMLELGKKAAITRKTSNTAVEPEVSSTGSRASNHYPLSAGSFTDDSEEWTGDEDDTISPAQEAADPFAPAGHTRTLSMPDMGNKDLNVVHQHSHSDISAEGSHIQARHEALQKLATFFHSPKPAGPASSSHEAETTRVLVKQEAVERPDAGETPETDFNPDTIILPPPDLYADVSTE